MQFCFRGEKSESEAQTLETFDVLQRLKTNNNYKDIFINVGGPVWAMDWCPRPTAEEGKYNHI